MICVYLNKALKWNHPDVFGFIYTGLILVHALSYILFKPFNVRFLNVTFAFIIAGVGWVSLIATLSNIFD